MFVVSPGKSGATAVRDVPAAIERGPLTHLRVALNPGYLSEALGAVCGGEDRIAASEISVDLGASQYEPLVIRAAVPVEETPDAIEYIGLVMPMRVD